MSMFGSSFNEFTGHNDPEHVEMHPEDELYGSRSKPHHKKDEDSSLPDLDLIFNTTPEQLREMARANLRKLRGMDD